MVNIPTTITFRLKNLQKNAYYRRTIKVSYNPSLLPMFQKTRVQFQVKSHQRKKKGI